MPTKEIKEMKSKDFVNEGESYYDKSQDYSKVRRGRVDKHAHLSDKEKDELQQHKSDWAERMRDLKMYEGEPVSSPKIDSVESVKQHHPEIYDFFKKTGSWMTFDRYGKVESYHTSGQKFIVIELGPTAGMENSKAVMRSAGIKFNEDQFGNLDGTFNGIHWTCRPGGVRGNQTETFRFAMPHNDNATATHHDRTMEAVDNMFREDDNFDQAQIESMIETELSNIMTDAWGYFGVEQGRTQDKVADYVSEKMQKLSDRAWEGLLQEPILATAIMDNFDYADDTGATSFIPAEVLLRALG